MEFSAPLLYAINSQIDGHATPVMPTDIVLGSSGSGSAGSGTVTAGSSSGTLSLNVNSAFTGLSQIDLQATHDITFAPNLNWNLGASTRLGSGTLTLVGLA